jgi:hypothetical protein
MSFNINNQTGGVINNVAGDQHITGGQQGTVVSTDDLRAAVVQVGHGLDDVTLGDQAAAEAGTAIEALKHEVSKETPDRSRVARMTESLTKILKGAGALVGAGAALIAPLQTIVNWLGGIGAPILALLPALG